MSKPKSIRRGIISNRASDSTETLGFMQKEIARLTQLLDEACAALVHYHCITQTSQDLRDYYGKRRSAQRRKADDVY